MSGAAAVLAAMLLVLGSASEPEREEEPLALGDWLINSVAHLGVEGYPMDTFSGREIGYDGAAAVHKLHFAVIVVPRIDSLCFPKGVTLSPSEVQLGVPVIPWISTLAWRPKGPEQQGPVTRFTREFEISGRFDGRARTLSIADWTFDLAGGPIFVILLGEECHPEVFQADESLAGLPVTEKVKAAMRQYLDIQDEEGGE